MDWPDRKMLATGSVVFWPWEQARRKHWSVRLAAMTLGWLWVAPAMLFILLPVMVICIPCQMFIDLGRE